METTVRGCAGWQGLGNVAHPMLCPMVPISSAMYATVRPDCVTGRALNQLDQMWSALSQI